MAKKKCMSKRDKGIPDMMRCDTQQSDGAYGVVVGTGNEAESNNDYKLDAR